MSDWIRVDYDNPATWPPDDSPVECLRLIDGMWWGMTGRARRHDDQPLARAGFSVSNFTVDLVRSPSLALPETTESSADWWRPTSAGGI